MIRNIEERIAKVTHLPVDHGEGMQVAVKELGLHLSGALCVRMLSRWTEGGVDSRNAFVVSSGDPCSRDAVFTSAPSTKSVLLTGAELPPRAGVSAAP